MLWSHYLALAAVAALAVAWAALARWTRNAIRRADREREIQAVEAYERAHALAQRCDGIQAELHGLAERQRIGHLFDLVACGEAAGVLPPAVAERLRRHTLALYAESLAGDVRAVGTGA